MSFDTLDERALDAAVAVRVFNLEVEPRRNARTRQADFVCREPGQDWNRVAYFGSLGASLKLKLRLRELGWTVKPSPFGRHPDPSGHVSVMLLNGEEEVDGIGASFEEALCRVALKAVEKP